MKGAGIVSTTATDMLGAALAYAELGYRVLPTHDTTTGACSCGKGDNCYSHGKHPRNEHGVLEATTDPDQIERWWAKWPNANVAIGTDGLLVVDVDVIDGQPNPWLTAERALELAAAPMQRTPRGGRHYVCRQPGGKNYRNTTSRLAHKVDTRADGGYILVAPSVVKGKPYRWASDRLDVPPDKLPEPPAWLVAMLDGTSHKGAAGKNGRAAPGDIIPEGKRNATLASLAGSMRRRGMGEPAILAALAQENQDRCRPPLPQSEVETIAASVGRYEPAAVNGNESDRRPKINGGIGDLKVLTAQAWGAIERANKPPILFRYGGAPARLERGDNRDIVVRLIEFHRMRYHLARVANWIKCRKIGDNVVEEQIAPPKDLVNDVLATPDQPLPHLVRVVEAPVFAADGTLQTRPGYHPNSHTYYAPAEGFSIPDVPDVPSGADLEAAREVIGFELLGDFPFVEDAEKAHAIALLLHPFARDLIDGPTPLHLFEKPSPGTGATLLVDMLAFAATGRPIPTMTEGRDEDEWRKRITAKLRTAPAFIFIDNLRRRLDSASVSSAITSPTWEDRILGISEMVRIPVRAAWVASGNNPAVSSEMARRIVRCRLDARIDRPWLRTGFRHDDLRQWTTEKRGLIVWSALTMIRAWLASGRPGGTGPKLGMFESWSHIMGGILEHAGIPGLLANLSDFYEQSDVEGTNWRAFLLAWWERFGEHEVKVADLYPIATSDGCIGLGDGSDQSQRVVLGKLLAEKRDRVFDLEIGRVTITRGQKRQRAFVWQLLRKVSV